MNYAWIIKINVFVLVRKHSGYLLNKPVYKYYSHPALKKKIKTAMKYMFALQDSHTIGCQKIISYQLKVHFGPKYCLNVVVFL